MHKLSLAVLAFAVLALPLAHAQAPGHTVSVAIGDLPASVLSNGTQAIVPFQVTATVSGAAPCLATGAGGASYTIKLDAVLENSTGNNTFVYVNPKQVTIAGPVLLPAPGGSAQRTIEGTLVVNAGPYTGDFLNATVKILATFEGSNGGCTGVSPAPASSDEASIRTDFEPVRGFGDSARSGNEMPGPGAALTLLGLVALAAFTRRQA